jgi:hypothetical protein
MLVKQLLLGLALPALVAVAVLVATWQPWRARRIGPGAWVGALALGAGFVAGYLALFGWPGLAPKESWEWLPHIVAAVTAAAMLVGWSRVPRPAGWAIVALAATAAAWLLVPRWQESRLAWTIALAVAVLVVWIALFTLAQRTSAVSPALVILIAASAAALVLERAATARFAQLAGVLAASVGGCLVVTLLRSAPKLGPGLAGGGAVLLVGLMFTGHFNHFSDTPPACFFLVALAPLLAWIGQWAPIRRRRSWQRLVFEAAAVLIPAAIALALAFAATNSNGAQLLDGCPRPPGRVAQNL